MESFIFETIAVALLTAFTILLLTKIGLRETIQIKSGKLISKLFSCDFCLSFWLALWFSLVLSIITQRIEFVFIPFLSTPLTRILI